MSAAVKPGVSAKSVYYYIINVQHPTRRRSLQDAIEARKDVFPKDEGEFQCAWVDISKNVSVYIYNFNDSMAASNVKSSHMYLYKVDVETASILPTVEQFLFVKNEFKFVNMVDYIAIARAAFLAGAEASLPTTDKELCVEESLPTTDKACVEFDGEVKKLRLSLPAMQVVPEVTHNCVIQERLAMKLDKLGFKVVGNKEAITSAQPVQLSKYYKSRPDIVIYHRTKLLAAVINSGESDEEADPSTLVGAVTENKSNDDGRNDVEGQLLAGMDKVAGELAHQQFCVASPEVFNKIEIFGLIIYHKTSDCNVYRLVMDFVKERSKLETGKQRLPMFEGLSRLVKELQRKLGLQ